MRLTLLFITVLSMTIGGYAFANEKPVAKGQSELYNSARSYELVIDGKVAQKIYESLTSEPKLVNSDGGWMNKIADNIVCGQNLISKKYFCSLSVDENGVQ